MFPTAELKVNYPVTIFMRVQALTFALVASGLITGVFLCFSSDKGYAAQSVEPDQFELSATDSASCVAQLKAKQLLFPIQGINPQSIRGSFSEVRGNSLHHASDIVAPRDTPVLAAGNGKIGRLWLSKAGGNTIYELDPSNNYAYYYAHLERYAPGLEEGAAVKRGQVIGFVGTSGDAPPNAPHLHFAFSKLVHPGVWWPGASIDPYEVFKGTAMTGPKLPPQPLQKAGQNK